MSVIKIEQQNKSKNFRIFGKISKYAVMDAALSCNAKALYALLCTYGAFGKITARIQLFCKDLNVSRKKLCALLFELSSQGYIEVIKTKSNGRFSNNNYNISPYPAKYWELVPENAKDAYAYEKIRQNGIQSYGYGLAEQRVLKDTKLHITAKAIYVYFSALSGNTNTVYPSIQSICCDLDICETTYYKYIKQLLDKKYVQVIEHKTQDGRYSPNEYALLGHPNAHKPSNYEKNIAAVNEKIQERQAAKSKQKGSPPSSKSGTQPYPKTEARSAKKEETKINIKSSVPYPKYDTRSKNEKYSESGVKPSDSQILSEHSFTVQTPAKPFRTEPPTKSPFPKNETLYNTNTVNTNNQKKNTLNQEGRKKLENNKSSKNINQSKSTSKKSDSIDKPTPETFFLNPDKIYQDLLKHNGIPATYLKNKAALEFIIKTASENADTPVHPISESLKAILRKSGAPFSDNNPVDSPLCRLTLKCLTDMLYDSGNFNKKYTPEEVAGFINTHIKVSDGVISFDNWLEKFEKSFMQSVGKPDVGNNIKNPYAYIKTSLWKFLATYNDFHFDFKVNSNTKQSSSNSDDFFDKIVRNSMKLRD